MPTGPCIGCGAINYRSSFGGPRICSACDCGISPEVTKLRGKVSRLFEKNMRLMLALEVALCIPSLTPEMEATGTSFIEQFKGSHPRAPRETR